MADTDTVVWELFLDDGGAVRLDVLARLIDVVVLRFADEDDDDKNDDDEGDLSITVTAAVPADSFSFLILIIIID